MGQLHLCLHRRHLADAKRPRCAKGEHRATGPDPGLHTPHPRSAFPAHDFSSYAAVQRGGPTRPAFWGLGRIPGSRNSAEHPAAQAEMGADQLEAWFASQCAERLRGFERGQRRRCQQELEKMQIEIDDALDDLSMDEWAGNAYANALIAAARGEVKALLAEFAKDETVRPTGWLDALSGSHSNSGLHGDFRWMRSRAKAVSDALRPGQWAKGQAEFTEGTAEANRVQVPESAHLSSSRLQWR